MGCNVNKHWLQSVVIDMNVVIVDIDSLLASETGRGVGVIVRQSSSSLHRAFSCLVLLSW